MSSLNFDAWMVFLHIVAATVLLGNSLFAPLTRSALRRASTVGEVRTWITIARRLTLLNPLSALIALASGVYLGSLGSWSSDWFIVSVVIFIVNAVVAGIFVGRLETRLSSGIVGLLAGRVPPAVDRVRWSAAWDLTGGVLLANDLALLFLMIDKPDLWPSIAVAIGANVLIVPAALLLRRSPAPAPDLGRIAL